MADESQVQNIAKNEEAVVITQEFLDDLSAHPEKIKDLSADVKRQITQLDMSREVTPAPAPVVKVEEKVIETAPEEPAWKVKAREEARIKNEANTYKQRLESERKKRERIEAEKRALADKLAQIEATKAQKTTDVFDENEQLALRDKVAKQEAELEFIKKQLLKSQEEELQQVEKNIAELSVEETFQKLEEFQNEFPELKTSRPIAEIDREYLAFQEGLLQLSGARYTNQAEYNAALNDAWKRFNTEEGFKSQVASAGLKLPPDMDQYKKVLGIHHAAKDGDYVGTYLKQRYQSEKTGNRETSRSQVPPAQAAPVVKRTPEPSATLLDIDRGSGNAKGPDMTPAEVAQFLESLKGKRQYSESDRATLQYIRENAVPR